MRILSYNVCGLRSAVDKGFGTFLRKHKPAIIGLQETRAREEQLVPYAHAYRAYCANFVAAERPGYSGVGLLSKRAPDAIVESLGEAEFDVEGRFMLARFGGLLIVNAYFPNGNGKNRDNSRIPYKLAFYRRLFDLLEEDRKKGVPILVIGDFNTAHREIDLARPKQNVKTSGFTPEEREELDRWLSRGWIDTFRHFEPGPGHYSWWSQRGGARERNVGWRIDYVLASRAAMEHVRGAFILREVMGSDHCPVGVEVDEAILSQPPRRSRA